MDTKDTGGEAFPLTPDTMLRIEKDGAFFERSWLQFQFDIALMSTDDDVVNAATLRAKFQLEDRGLARFGGGWVIRHPNSIVEID